jgi:biopolymer transport protein ExbD
MSETATGKQKAEPNLTPILDMVFQLITFFMLVINFKSAELDLSLKLPVVGSARPVPVDPTELLVFNIKWNKDHPDGFLSIYSHERYDVDKYIRAESKAVLDKLNWKRSDIEEGGPEGVKELPTTIVIRADRETPFRAINYVIDSCQKSGFRKFALKALGK